MASASGISSRLFGSAVRSAHDKTGSSTGKGGRIRGKVGAARVSEAGGARELAAPATSSSGGAGVRGRGPRSFGGGAGGMGGTGQALHGGCGGNPRASAFAQAFDVEEADWPAPGPVRRGRQGSRAGPYEDFDDTDADFNGFPRYSQHDWNEPAWEHDQFEGPQTIGSAIFVRNLPPGIEGHQLKHLFEEAGQIANIQVDNGPLPSATIGYVRQAVAFDAAELFHGRWLLGHELKVSVKAAEPAAGSVAEDEFWRQELRDMRQHGQLIRNDPGMLMQFGDWEEEWHSGGAWAGKGGRRGAKGRATNVSRWGGKGDDGPSTGMRSAVAWDD